MIETCLSMAKYKIIDCYLWFVLFIANLCWCTIITAFCICNVHLKCAVGLGIENGHQMQQYRAKIRKLCLMTIPLFTIWLDIRFTKPCFVPYALSALSAVSSFDRLISLYNIASTNHFARSYDKSPFSVFALYPMAYPCTKHCNWKID